MNAPLNRWLVAVLLGSWTAAVSPAIAGERLEPAQGCYLGFNLGTDDSIARLSARLDLTPAVFVQFYEFPFPGSVPGDVAAYLTAVRDAGGIALLTLEPMQGLDSVAASNCVALADLCADFEAQGIGGIMIRFAHEMNGSWYPWGQQPIRFKEKFRLLAQAVHARTTRTALLWAPNHGLGYPFSQTSPYRAQPGTPDYTALDTDGDGQLTQADDMYEPYYPGDDVVDWVGLTVYHWGANFPWLENELPLPNAFANALTGTNGGLPNFYDRYSADGVRNKPLAIAETSALYNTEQPGANELALKQAWWRQVFNISGDRPDALDVAAHFPKLKCVNWFDHYKPEAELGNQLIDWRVSVHPVIRAAFLDDIRQPRNGQPYFLTAPEFQREMSANAIVPLNLPNLLPLNGDIPLRLQTKATANCDLVIDLLDPAFNWLGGTRVAVAAGVQDYAANLTLQTNLVDGKTYRWSIFLTPSGSNYLGALAWYKGPLPVARALVPEVALVHAPDRWLPGTGLTARINYTAPSNCFLHLNLLDAGLNRRLGVARALTRLDGAMEVTLPSRTGLPDGAYFLEAVLADATGTPPSVLAQSARFPILLAGAPNDYRVQVVPEPAGLPAGEVFRFLASFQAVADCDLRLELSDPAGAVVGAIVQPVPAGADLRELTISYTNAAPGDYQVRAALNPSGQTNAPALAQSPPARVEVYSRAYLGWIEWHWGRLLAFDPINPSQDPDGDRATNQNENLARTNPRDPFSVLRARLRFEAGNAFVQWHSVPGLSYQVLATADLKNPQWTPVGTALEGTGQLLELPTGSVNGIKFYRIQCAEIAGP